MFSKKNGGLPVLGGMINMFDDDEEEVQVSEKKSNNDTVADFEIKKPDNPDIDFRMLKLGTRENAQTDITPAASRSEESDDNKINSNDIKAGKNAQKAKDNKDRSAVAPPTIQKKNIELASNKSDSGLKKKFIYARVTPEFKEAIELYCLENDYKISNIIVESVSRVIGYGCKELGLTGKNCLYTNTNTSWPYISLTASADMKKALRFYAKKQRLSENAVVAQAVADKVGYTK